MKDYILKALADRFEGVSEKILGRVAERLARTAATEEDAKAAAEAVTIQQLLDSYGDSRATESARTAVANYERRYGLKDGVADGGGTGGEPGDPEGSGGAQGASRDGVAKLIAEAVGEAVRPLQEKLARLETERRAGGRKAKLGAVLSRLPEGLRKGYERIPLDAMGDEDFEALLGEVSTEVDAAAKDMETRGAVFGAPLGGGGATPRGDNGGEATKEETESVVAQLNI